jgi:glycosyltransferase involved in cell wall biosynthesis/LmbE family N-acetylglucosaminyl deacetylase
VFITSGELGDWQGGQDADACRVRREGEACRALTYLGVKDWEFWRYSDRGVVADGSLVERLTEAVGAFRATLVYASSPLEIHPDHRALAQALRIALRGWPGELRVGFYEVGYALPPNTLVDTTAVLETKEKAIRAYESQLLGRNYLEVSKGFGRVRALTLGPDVVGAEAFHIVAVSNLESDSIWRWQVLQEPSPAPDRPPGVSVIVRTKDRPAFLHEALASLAAQTFRDFEVVVVNDGGRDISAVIADYPHLRINLLWLQPNRGRASAANAGVEAARGEFVAYLDDDDLYYPPHLETLYTFLSEHNHFGATYSDACVSHYRLNTESKRYEFVERRVRYSRDFDPDLLLYQNYIHNLSFMHRRDAWERVGGFDPSLDVLEDWDFFIRVAQLYPFYHVPRCTAEYRVRNDGTNISQRTLWAQSDEARLRLKIYQRHRDKRTPELEMRFNDRLQYEISQSQRNLEERALVEQGRDRALAAVRELGEALDDREKQLREKTVRLEEIYNSTTWKLYCSCAPLLRRLVIRPLATLKQWFIR